VSELAAVEILLVEDNPADAEMTQRALKVGRLVNRVMWVRDGAEALDYLFCRGPYADRDNGNPKVVLLDLKMPKVDGIQVLREVRGDARTRTVPVVMLTSSAEEGDIARSYESGINSYIVKPVDFEKFVEEVSKLGVYWALMNKPPA
jgi:CheY-like chemotaxis protein